jgi:hypothetical protein
MVGDDGYGVPNRFGRVGAIPLKAIRVVGRNHMPTGHSITGTFFNNTATRVPLALSQNTLSVQIVICPSLSRLPACPAAAGGCHFHETELVSVPVSFVLVPCSCIAWHLFCIP